MSVLTRARMRPGSPGFVVPCGAARSTDRRSSSRRRGERSRLLVQLAKVNFACRARTRVVDLAGLDDAVRSRLVADTDTTASARSTDERAVLLKRSSSSTTPLPLPHRDIHGHCLVKPPFSCGFVRSACTASTLAGSSVTETSDSSRTATRNVEPREREVDVVLGGWKTRPEVCDGRTVHRQVIRACLLYTSPSPRDS